MQSECYQSCYPPWMLSSLLFPVLDAKRKPCSMINVINPFQASVVFLIEANHLFALQINQLVPILNATLAWYCLIYFQSREASTGPLFKPCVILKVEVSLDNRMLISRPINKLPPIFHLSVYVFIWKKKLHFCRGCGYGNLRIQPTLRKLWGIPVTTA